MRCYTIFQSIFSPMFLSKIVQFGLAFLMSGIVLQTVVANLNEREPGGVVVHVMESDVVLTIDDVVHRIEQQIYNPIYQQLQPGTHKLRMTRGDQVIHEQDFALQGGEEIVLTAYVPSPKEKRRSHEKPAPSECTSTRSAVLD